MSSNILHTQPKSSTSSFRVKNIPDPRNKKKTIQVLLPNVPSPKPKPQTGQAIAAAFLALIIISTFVSFLHSTPKAESAGAIASGQHEIVQ